MILLPCSLLIKITASKEITNGMNAIKTILFFILFYLSGLIAWAQNPNPALIGYWQNWDDADCPYFGLEACDNRYNVIIVGFAMATSATNMNMVFIPEVATAAVFKSKVQLLQSQGKKVLISIGGATTSISLGTTAKRDAFVSSINTIINTYGFDGIDIDIESGTSIVIGSGTIAAPANVAMINLIDAIKLIMTNYRTTHLKKLYLTMAPQTVDVQGGQKNDFGSRGGYLPIINSLRDSIDILHVQLYNSGSMWGLDGGEYFEGTADFIVAMTDATIHGFNTTGGLFAGIPASKVAIGLPACPNAASGGYVTPDIVKKAIDYLRGDGPKPGTYVLSQSGGYPDLRGMMTWSVNWDAVNTCASTYEFAGSYEAIFTPDPPAVLITKTLSAGWTWFSINVENPVMTIDQVFSSISFSNGDYIKNLTLSATYYTGTGWFGELTSLDPREMYKIKLAAGVELVYEGFPIDPQARPITINAGWNWIGYLPQSAQAIVSALLGINPVEGDYLKNQSVSSTYYTGYGWFGELSAMNPLDGFMMKVSHPGVLTYPTGTNPSKQD